MSFFDFNNAEQQKGGGTIPANTMCRVRLELQGGGKGPDPNGLVHLSGSSEAQYLKIDLTVTHGQYAKRHIFENTMVGGVTDQCVNISRTKFRSIIESAYGIKPDDLSPEAKAKRAISGFAQLHGLEFAIKVGLEKDKTGAYEDKNKILAVITPEHKQYAAIMAGTDVGGGTPSVGTAPIPTAKPEWAVGESTDTAPAAPVQQSIAPAPAPPVQAPSAVPAWAQ